MFNHKFWLAIYASKCINPKLWIEDWWINHIEDYQNTARIYLDEYEVEEVDLRVNFDTSLIMKRFMVKE
jgi:hypothetical protein